MGSQGIFDKTRFVIFLKGHININLQKYFQLGEKIIQFKNFYEYLDVEISDKCDFFRAKKERCAEARPALFMIKQVWSTSSNVSIKLAKNCLNLRLYPYYRIEV